MTFLNEWEVMNLVDRFFHDRTMGPVVITLRNFVNAVNENSDGWCYWRPAQRAAQRLVAVCEFADKAYRDGDEIDHDSVVAAYERGVTVLKRFRTTHKIDFEIVRHTA